jgi:hypothetical protein
MVRTKFKKQELSQKERLLMFSKLKKLGVRVTIDGFVSSAKGELHIDVMKLDTSIPNYDGKTCMYKEKPNYSMAMAIDEEYGEGTMDMVYQLI